MPILIVLYNLLKALDNKHLNISKKLQQPVNNFKPQASFVKHTHCLNRTHTCLELSLGDSKKTNRCCYSYIII